MTPHPAALPLAVLVATLALPGPARASGYAFTALQAQASAVGLDEHELAATSRHQAGSGAPLGSWLAHAGHPPRQLFGADGSAAVAVHAVNDHGEAAGACGWPLSVTCTWSGASTATLLPPLADAVISSAEAIDDAGTVVGTTELSDGEQFATLWANGTAYALPGGEGGANAIDASLIAGYSQGQAAEWIYFELTPLPDLPAYPRYTSVALSINAFGIAVGDYDDTAGVHHAVRWQQGVAAELPALGSSHPSCTAEAINEAGAIVGRCAADNAAGAAAVIWVGGLVTDLNGDLPEPARRAGWVLTDARAVNGTGKILADAVKPGDQASEPTHVVVLMTPR